MVLRERPVRRAISLMDSSSRRAQRLMTLSDATSITTGPHPGGLFVSPTLHIHLLMIQAGERLKG